MSATRFEWDPEKEQANIAKHSITFERAARVFADARAISEADEYIFQESRWRTVGWVDQTLLVVVIHVQWEEDYDGDVREVIRIISARPAERREKRLYAKNIRKF